MKRPLPLTDSRYTSVWFNDPPLADWLDRLPNDTTLASVRDKLNEIRQTWAEVSADPKSRACDYGAASYPECQRITNQMHPEFKALMDFG